MPTGIYIRTKPPWNRGKRTSMVKVACKFCDKEFDDYVSSNRKVCSFECHWKLMSLNRKGINPWAGRPHPKGTLGRKYKMPEETKRKIRSALLGKSLSKEHCEKIRLSHLGIKMPPFSEEHRKKISLSNLGRKLSAKQKKNLSIAFLTRKFPKTKNTSIELKLQNWLKEQNIEFETNYPITGRPDIFIKPNICIFADGCYWHKCPDCGLGHLRERDREVTQELQKQGYIVIRIWEHDIKNNQLGQLNQLTN